MKTLLLTLCLAVSTICFADQTVTPEDLAAAPTMNLLEIGAKGAKFYDGKVIKLTFGWKQGEMIYAKKGKSRTGVKVTVSPAGQAWFSALPTQETATSSQSAYVKFYAAENGNERMEIVGRDIKNGELVW